MNQSRYFLFSVLLSLVLWGCGSGKDEPLIWTLKYGTGRVFQTALGHDVKSMESAGFRLTLVRGTEWAATGTVTIPVPADLK